MKKIYLIDDDPFFLKLLSKKLWEFGYSVKTFLSVEDALPNLSETPDLIVLDHNFGTSEVKGNEYIPLLKRHSDSAALIYVTTETSSEIINKSIQNGADMYLTKDNNLYNNINPVIQMLLSKKNGGLWKKIFK